MNAWEELGLPVKLAIGAEEVEASFREVSQGAHPDAGGEAGEFERMREARDLLKDDFRRLDLWLEVKGIERAHSGAVSQEVGVMFGRVNEVTTGVDEWLQKGEGVTSGLGKALWQKEGFGWKARLEEVLSEVDVWQQRVVDEFSQLEGLPASEVEGESLAMRGELGFLRKWRLQLQARFGRLWEGLI